MRIVELYSSNNINSKFQETKTKTILWNFKYYIIKLTRIFSCLWWIFKECYGRFK